MIALHQSSVKNMVNNLKYYSDEKELGYISCSQRSTSIWFWADLDGEGLCVYEYIWELYNYYP